MTSTSPVRVPTGLWAATTIVCLTLVAAAFVGYRVWSPLVVEATPAPTSHTPPGTRSPEPLVDTSAASPEFTGLAEPSPILDNTPLPRVLTQASAAIGKVRSVEFRLERSGAPIYIDQFQRLSLDDLLGQFVVPGKAQAEVTVGVGNGVSTRLAAVALGEEVWLSNPITGKFETLPDGYDIDPSSLFDLSGGWQPLLGSLADTTEVSSTPTTLTIRGLAPAAQITKVTIGLVRDQDVPVTFTLDRATSLVSSAQFETTFDGEVSIWQLELTRFNEPFTITRPEVSSS